MKTRTVSKLLGWTRALAMAALGVACVACSGEGSVPEFELPGEEAAPSLPSDALVLAEFKAKLDPKTKTLTFERVEREGDLGARSIDDALIQQDGVAGSGSANTVELVTNSVTGTETTGVWSANVTLRHFFPRPLSNVFVQVYDMDPKDGLHNAVGDDPSEHGLVDTYGLWKYTASAFEAQGFSGLLGETAPHNEGTRDWSFNNPDMYATTYWIRVVTSLSYANYDYGFAFAAPDDPTYDACDPTGDVSGSRAVYSSSVLRAARTLPFGFTLYGYTARHISFARRGIVTFSNVSQTDANNKQTDSGTNLDLPRGDILPKPAVFAFWDDIRHNTAATAIDGTAGRMCYKVVGTEPFRQAVVTWEDFRFSGTVQADKLHFSAVLYEGTDQVEILHHDMTSTDALRAAGGSATIGLQNSSGNLALDDYNVANYGSLASVALVPLP